MNQKQDKLTIIAEAGVNHNGSLETALAMVDAAAEAGADVFKIQSFRADSLASPDAPLAGYQKKGTRHHSQWDMLHALELNLQDHEAVIKRCAQRKIQFLSSPFDRERLAMLVQLGVTAVKIASGEITNGPLLLAAARTNLPVILSTGMASLGEVEEALSVLAFGYSREGTPETSKSLKDDLATETSQFHLKKKVTLLHCTTAYPTPPESVNLRAMDTLHTTFGLPVGYSDHTRGINIALAAAARGAVVIEKHFTLDRNQEGPDHTASLEPKELAKMVCGIREITEAMGDGHKQPTHAELENLNVARKRLITATAVPKGTHFSEENLTTRRPANGLTPMAYWSWLGQVAQRDYAPGEPLP